MANEKRIMVVDRQKIFGKYNGRHFEGFKPVGIEIFQKLISKNYFWMERSRAEDNPNFKQPIPYVIVFNSSTGKIFTYRRAVKSGESRLSGKSSLGIGGHVELQDDSHILNPIYTAMLRELREEIMCNYIDARLLGFINVEETDVDKVHFGLCYLIETNSDVTICDKNLEDGKMQSIDEIESEIDKYEKWSKIAFEQLKELIV